MKVFALCSLLFASTFQASADNPLLGAWQVKSVTWHTEKGDQGIEKAQPGLFIFTDSHYSLMWTPTKDARTPFKVLSKPTDEEAIAGFKSVVFNGGSYHLTSKNTLTSQAMIAKVPGFEGGKQMYEFQFNDQVLLLTMVDEVYPDGSKPTWSGKVKVTFTLELMTP